MDMKGDNVEATERERSLGDMFLKRVMDLNDKDEFMKIMDEMTAALIESKTESLPTPPSVHPSSVYVNNEIRVVDEMGRRKQNEPRVPFRPIPNRSERTKNGSIADAPSQETIGKSSDQGLERYAERLRRFNERDSRHLRNVRTNDVVQRAESTARHQPVRKASASRERGREFRSSDQKYLDLSGRRRPRRGIGGAWDRKVL